MYVPRRPKPWGDRPAHTRHDDLIAGYHDSVGNIEEAEADGLWRPIAETRVSKRVIACLDVRSNDEGDLVVTKGDQYDVRERAVRVCVRRRMPFGRFG